MAPLSFTPEPLNQGRQGTCVHHAVAQVICEWLRLKYEIAVPATTAVTVLKTACPGFAGTNVNTLCETWNRAKPPLETMSSEQVIKTRITCTNIDFEQAIDEISKFAGTPHVVATYNVNNDPARSHGIAAFDVVDRQGSAALTHDTKDLVCVNSWGGQDMYVYLNKPKVKEVWLLDVAIEEMAVSGRPMAIPQEGWLYRSMRARTDEARALKLQLEETTRALNDCRASKLRAEAALSEKEDEVAACKQRLEATQAELIDYKTAYGAAAAAAAALPTEFPEYGRATARFAVGDVWRCSGSLCVRESEDTSIANEVVVLIDAGSEVEVREIGTGPTGKRIRIRSDPGGLEGWVSVVNAACEELLTLVRHRATGDRFQGSGVALGGASPGGAAVDPFNSACAVSVMFKELHRLEKKLRQIRNAEEAHEGKPLTPQLLEKVGLKWQLEERIQELKDSLAIAGG